MRKAVLITKEFIFILIANPAMGQVHLIVIPRRPIQPDHARITDSFGMPKPYPHAGLMGQRVTPLRPPVHRPRWTTGAEPVGEFAMS